MGHRIAPGISNSSIILDELGLTVIYRERRHIPQVALIECSLRQPQNFTCQVVEVPNALLPHLEVLEVREIGTNSHEQSENNRQVELHSFVAHRPSESSKRWWFKLNRGFISQ